MRQGSSNFLGIFFELSSIYFYVSLAHPLALFAAGTGFEVDSIFSGKICVLLADYDNSTALISTWYVLKVQGHPITSESRDLYSIVIDSLFALNWIQKSVIWTSGKAGISPPVILIVRTGYCIPLLPEMICASCARFSKIHSVCLEAKPVPYLPSVVVLLLTRKNDFPLS